MVNLPVQGWLPAEIHFDRQPAIVPGGRVRWVEVGARRLSEPFLEQTFDNLREATPSAKEVDTDLETLLRIGRRLPASRPAGLIFHVSHCGSTLIANVLKAAENTVVVSESSAVAGLLRPYAEPPGRYLADRWALTQRAALEALFATHACYRTGAPERLVIKCTSLNILSLSAVRVWWPDVPCIRRRARPDRSDGSEYDWWMVDAAQIQPASSARDLAMEGPDA